MKLRFEQAVGQTLWVLPIDHILLSNSLQFPNGPIMFRICFVLDSL